MSRITVPTIVLHAKDDFLVTYDHAEFVNQNQ
jgi:predicted alpha/beta-fold hydrolase